MKLVFSRKGFDSASGGYPSPIVDGVPISLPIPVAGRSETTYGDLGLGELVERVTKGRLTAGSKCHCDPMFENGRCAFGQTGAAQTHLERQGVSEGDVFLFFGLFSDLAGRDRHHRIFAWLKVEERRPLGGHPSPQDQPAGFSIRHPHTIGTWNDNNCLYLGPAGVARKATDALRLSVPGGLASLWRIPTWLRNAGLSYHGKAHRWKTPGILKVVARGQEFVADIGGVSDAGDWLADILRTVNAD